MHEKLLQLADALRNDRRQVNGSFDFVACVNEHAKRLYGQDFPAPEHFAAFFEIAPWDADVLWLYDWQSPQAVAEKLQAMTKPPV